jgi:energy-coupling factor transporter ATP-binding protein EcfA2
MASRRNRPINLPAPYLKRIWLEPSRITNREAYPFCLPLLRDDFELSFDRAITIIVGENGTGKSTLLEGIAVLAGYDEAGGGKGYMPVDHSNAIEVMAGLFQRRFAPAGCRKSLTAGSSGQKASSQSRDTWMKSRAERQAHRPTTFRIPTAKAFCASSRSVASGRASSSSTNRNPRCRHRARSSS